jgi:hypothetical protein
VKRTPKNSATPLTEQACLQIMGIEKGEEIQAKGMHNIFIKTKQKFSQIFGKMLIQAKRHDQNRNTPWHIS